MAGWNVLPFSLTRLLSMSRRHPARLAKETSQVLAIVPQGPNRLLLQAMSDEAGWKVVVSDFLPNFNGRPPSGVPPIILVDRELAIRDWREVVGVLTNLSPRPYIILISPNTDANLWDELQRVGGSDILRAPLTRDHLLAALGRASQLVRSQQRVRGLLTKA